MAATSHSIHADVRGLPLPLPMLEALGARFGTNFSTAMAVREHHGRDESPFPVTPPEAVVFAESNVDVVDAVKLYPVPEAMSAAVCCFDSLKDAIDTVIETIRLGVPVARCEYLGAKGVELIRRVKRALDPDGIFNPGKIFTA